MTAWDEPGRSVAEDGRIVYAWPPEGRFRELCEWHDVEPDWSVVEGWKA